jgi:hypothetical protein
MINDNVIILPEVSQYFACDLTSTEVEWLRKKHIFKHLIEEPTPTTSIENLKIYSQTDECIPEYDMQNGFALLRKLNNKIAILQSQNIDLEQHLKKYTNGDNHKRYYEKNKEKIKETGASYLQKLKAENPEKIKEYSHRAYLNQKEKKLKKMAAEAEKNPLIKLSV